MRLLTAMLLTVSILGCHSPEKTLRVMVLAKTQDMVPIAGAEVMLNDRVIGLTDNFGAFHTTETFEINRKPYNVFRVTKFSELNKFEDAIIVVSDQALSTKLGVLNVPALLKVQPVGLKEMAVAAKTAPESEAESEDNALAGIEAEKDEAKVESAPVKVAAKLPAIKSAVNPVKPKNLGELQFNNSRKSIANGNPQQALADAQKLTLLPNGTRNYNLGELYSAHINEAIAYYMIANKLLERNDQKQAVAQLEKSIAVLNLCLNNIDKAPEKIRDNVIIEARFNRALALQKLYLDLNLANYKIETYRAWRGVYMSLSKQGQLGGRRASIQKYAVQTMQKMGQDLL